MSARPHDAATGGACYLLGIAGSPRRGGNSDLMLDAALQGAEAAGIETRRVVVADADVGWCRGCNGCFRDGHCIRHDGMDAIYPMLDEAAGFVVATPVFFASVPAVLKSLLDRFQPYYARRYVLHQPAGEAKRPAALLISAGGGDPYGHECAEAPVRSAFAVLGVEVVGIVTAVPVDHPGDVLGRQKTLDACRLLGGDIARRADSSI